MFQILQISISSRLLKLRHLFPYRFLLCGK
nr:MAG TPA: hypothetical protein [Caudoviricetes sp.]